MRRRFKIAFVMFLVVTVAWALACYLHVSAYNKYIREGTEHYLSLGFSEEFVRGYVDFYPIWIWGHTPVLLIAGFFMILAWIGFCLKIREKAKRRTFKPELTTLEA